MPDTASQDNSALDLSGQVQKPLEQYVPGQDGTHCLSQSSRSPQDSNLSPSVSLEQFIAWNLPSLAAGDRAQTPKTSIEPWECPDLEGSSMANSSKESVPCSSASFLNWSFDLASQKRYQSQALCNFCSNRSDKLSLHASHSFWPLATVFAQNVESTLMMGMDELLELNRDTIQTILNILDCSCSENVLLLEKCSTNIGRVIDWYAGAFFGHDMIMPVTVRIGSYTTSPAKSHNQTSAIVLSEMQSLIIPLLDRLGQVYERHKSLHGGSGVGVGDPNCHRIRVTSFFASVRQSSRASL